MTRLPTATVQETDDGTFVKCPSCNTKIKLISEDDLLLSSGENPLQPEMNRLMYDKAILEEKNRQLLDALEEVRQKGIQNSSSLIGRILERDMFDVLSEEFTTDTITRVVTKGGDFLFTVNSQSGKAGTILIEVKNTKTFMSEWTNKVKIDAREAEADIPLIITKAIPRKMTRNIDRIDGVYVCKPDDAIGMIHILRQVLIMSTGRRMLSESRNTAAEMLYDQITSPTGIARLQALFDGYQRTVNQIQAEKRASDLNFRKREAEARNFFNALVDTVTSIQMAIGSESIPQLTRMMELPS